MKKNKISKNWVIKQKRDIYVRQSKVDGYRARSAYKLIEIDQKFKIFKGGMCVIDIGAAPGSWSQYVSKIVKNGKIISVDLKNMEKIKKTIQIVGDFTEEDTQNEIKNFIDKGADVIMSDMAVNTTGIKNIDSIQTGELCKEAMIFSKKIMFKKGIFISKIFMGGSFNEIVALGKKFLERSRFLNQSLVERIQKKVSLFVKILDRHF